MVAFGLSGCIRVKVVVFGPKWLYSVKTDFIRAKVVIFGQTFCTREKMVIFGQKWL